VVRFPGEVVAKADLVADMELVVTQDVVNLAHGVLLELVRIDSQLSGHGGNECSVRLKKKNVSRHFAFRRTS